MKKIRDFVKSKILSKIERQLKPRSILSLLMISYSFTLIRDFLESSLGESNKIGFIPLPFSSFIAFFYHYPIYYFCIFLFITIILSLSRSFTPKMALKIGLFFSFWFTLAPLFDLLFGGHMDYNYITSSNQFLHYLISIFNPFVHTPGVTPGMRIQGALVFLGLFIFMTLKRKNIILNILLLALLYIFMILTGGVLQSFIVEIFGSNFNQAYNGTGIIFYPSLRLSLPLLIVFVFEVAIFVYLYAKKRFLTYLKILLTSPRVILRLLYYFSINIMGFLIGLKTLNFAYPLIFKNPTDYLALIALFSHTLFAFLFGLTINDYFDKDGDLQSGTKTPFTEKIIRKPEMVYLSVFYFIISFLFAFSISYYTSLIAIVSLILAYLYSAPPYSLKKVWPLSVYTVAAISFLELLVGISVLGKYAALSILPKPMWAIFFIILPLVLTTKDIKDYKGDRVLGAFTIYTWLGIRRGALLNGILLFISFLLIPIIFKGKFLLISIFVGSATSIYVILSPRFRTIKLNEPLIFLVLLWFMVKLTGATLELIHTPTSLSKIVKYLREVQYNESSDETSNLHALSLQSSFFELVMEGDSEKLNLFLQALTNADQNPYVSFNAYNRLSEELAKKTGCRFYDPYTDFYIKNLALKQIMLTGDTNLQAAFISQNIFSGILSHYFYYSFGNLLFEKKHFNAALESYKAAYILNPTPPTALSIALSYKRIGNIDSFIHYFNLYLKLKGK